jgi:hypothetical protein
MAVSSQYIIKGRWGRLTDEIEWKWQKELEQFAVVFSNRAPRESISFPEPAILGKEREALG